MGGALFGGAGDARFDLVFGSSPGAVFFLLLIAGAAYLLLQRRLLAGSAPKRVSLALTLSRVALLSLALFLALQPTILKQRLAFLPARLPVLVDTSLSMSLAHDAGRTRLQAAGEAVKHLAAAAPGHRRSLELYAFDEGARPLTLEGLAETAAEGRKTDLAAALGTLAAGAGLDRGDTVVVLTDGRPVVGGGELPGGPRLVIVGVGSREAVRDVRLTQLKVPDMGFLEKPVEIEATVENDGYAGEEVPLSLKVDGQLVALEKVVMPSGGDARKVFQWTPREPGSYRVTVEVAPREGELVVENNLAEASVKVIRDRTRVLFISGSPTWNYRFLREALKSDPTLDLISFIILRSPTDVISAPQDEVALIPFPTQKIFTEELDTFDLVIFDNFSYRPYFPTEYLERLKKRVSEGGAFWMWGGVLSFIDGHYRGTPVEEILPFDLQGPPPGEGYVEQTFKPVFTAAAMESPVFAWASVESGEGKPWELLPPLRGFNVVGAPRRDSVVLVEHPSYRVEGSAAPLVAMRSVGKGRVMAVATDDLWSWDFIAAGRGLGNRAYLEFIKRSVRWLTGDPYLAPVRLSVTPEGAGAGDLVTVRVRVLDDGFRPIENASLDLNVETPGGARVNLGASPAAEAGLYEATYRLPGGGGYRFTVNAGGAGGPAGSAEMLLAAETSRGEFDSPVLDEEGLRRLAESSGGTFILYGDDNAFQGEFEKALEGIEGRPRLLGEERMTLGSLPTVFVVLVLLLGVDWFIRKRYRLE